jgi:hypothetical protein
MISAFNEDIDDGFGWAVAIDGDTIAVGATKESSNQTTITNGTSASTDNSLPNSGAVYVYKRTDTTWTQEAYIKAPNADSEDYFGGNLALHGDTLVVGVYNEDSNQTTITNGTTASTDNSLVNSGAVYVYRRTGSTWAQEAYIKPVNAASNREFGYSVAISGDTIAVGMIRSSSNSNTIVNGTTAPSEGGPGYFGSVFVYKRTGTSWIQEAYIKPLYPDGTDFFGVSVVLDGDTLAVGTEDWSNQTTITNGNSASSDNSSEDRGAVYVYKRSSNLWAQEAYIKPSANANYAYSFGRKIALHGDLLVVGTDLDRSSQNFILNGTTNAPSDASFACCAGGVYAYRRVGSLWSQEAYIKPSNLDDGDRFGYSVSVYNDTIIVGSLTEDSNQTTVTNGNTASSDNSRTNFPGAAYAFKKIGSQWRQTAYLKSSFTGNIFFGAGTSISGNTIVVGSPGNGSIGAVHVFTME